MVELARHVLDSAIFGSNCSEDGSTCVTFSANLRHFFRIESAGWLAEMQIGAIW